MSDTSPGSAPAQQDTKKILAITACPTGIAHTYMAAENLQQAAAELGYSIAVETHGSVGIEGRFSDADIADADALVVAADKQVELDRFTGIPTVVTKVGEGIRAPKDLIQRALNAEPLHGQRRAAAESSPATSLGGSMYKALMNGVSHMIPFVVTGGLLIAIALSIGGVPTETGLQIPEDSLWATVLAVGSLSFTLMVPILSGYIAMAIADRPGLAPGMITGYIAITGSLYNSDAGAGFLGAIITGFASGYVALLIKKIPVHKYIQPIMPIIIIPIATTVIVSAAFIFLIGHPVASLFEFLTTWLAGMEGASVVLLGAILGAMAGFDMGGPVNKTAFLFSGGLIASGNAYPMGMMAAAIAVPPLGMGLATLVRRTWFSKQEAESGIAALFMGFFGITEGAIPFAAARPLQIIPANVIGGAVAGGLAGLFSVQDNVMHGGPIVAVLGAVDGVGLYFVAILAGTVTTAAVAIGLMALQRRSASNAPNPAATPAAAKPANTDSAAASQPANTDPDGTAKPAATDSAAAATAGSVAGFLHPQSVLLDQHFSSREEAIRSLAQLGGATGQISDVEGVVSAALAREELSPTAVGMQVAIPHAKTAAVASPFIGFARVAGGLDWDAPDKDPVRLVFLIGVPAEQAGNQHLKILAKLSRALMKAPLRQQLLQASTAEQAHGIITEAVS